MENIKTRLEYLRKQIENESISYGEIAELQSLADHIDKNDTLLLQWAGVEENDPDNNDFLNSPMWKYHKEKTSRKKLFKPGLYCVKVRGRGEAHIELTAQEAKTLTSLAEGRWHDLQAVFKL